MTDANRNVLTDQAIAELKSIPEVIRREIQNQLLENSDSNVTREKQLRIGQIISSTVDVPKWSATYEVELGSVTFETDAPLDDRELYEEVEWLEFTNYEPSGTKIKVAHTGSPLVLRTGKLVIMGLIHGKWHIIKPVTPELLFRYEATSENEGVVSSIIEDEVVDTFEIYDPSDSDLATMAIGDTGTCYLMNGRFYIIGGGDDESKFLRFTSAAAMADRVMTTIVDFASAGTGLSVGDYMDVYDPNNLWQNAQENATGTAYWRESLSRWEIETCTLPINRVRAVLDDTMFWNDDQAFPIIQITDNDPADFMLSSYPHVDWPNEWGTTPSSTISIYASNRRHLDAKSGGYVVVENIGPTRESDPNNLTAPKEPRSGGVWGTGFNWVVTDVDRQDQKARWLLIEWRNGSTTIVDHWEGTHPDEFDGQAELTWPMGMPDCAKYGSLFLACYRPETNAYAVITSGSGVLGDPVIEEVHYGEITVDECNLTYKTKNIKTFEPCEEEGGGMPQEEEEDGPGEKTVSLGVTTVDVLTSASLTELGLTFPVSQITVCKKIDSTPIIIPVTDCVVPKCKYTLTYSAGGGGTYTWEPDPNFVCPDGYTCPDPPFTPQSDDGGYTVDEVIELDCVEDGA